MPSKSSPLVIILLATLSNVCMAADSSTVVDVGTLSQVQSEAVLYKAQAERASALRSITGEGTSAPGPAPVFQAYPQQTQRNSASSAEGLPVVSLISGSSRAPRATLLYSSGYEVEAQTIGADLPGGFKLASIGLDGVVLIRAGKLFPLGFSNRAPQP